MNPLLSPSHLPDFAAIEPAHIEPAITQLLDAAKTAQAQVTAPDFPTDLHAMERVLDVATDALGLAWGAVGHLNAVADTPELRAAYNAMLPTVSSFFAELGADEALYAKYKAVPAPADSAEARALQLALQGFVLSGAELQGAAKTRFAEIQNRSAELCQSFSEHVMDATDGFALFVAPERLAGVPADVIAHAIELANQEGRPGQAKLTLHAPCYGPLMQYAQDQSLREQLYRAYVTRASELGPPERDNSAVMQEILTLRQEEAQLLGHPHFAAVSLLPKMADSPTQVLGFLRDLAARARPFAERDLAALRAFAPQVGLTELQAWDHGLCEREALKASRVQLQRARSCVEYFTLPQVLDGLVRVCWAALVRPAAHPPSKPRYGMKACGPTQLHRAGRAGRAMCTWICWPAPASAQAPGWTMCVAAGGAPTRKPSANAHRPSGLQFRARGSKWTGKFSPAS